MIEVVQVQHALAGIGLKAGLEVEHRATAPGEQSADQAEEREREDAVAPKRGHAAGAAAAARLLIGGDHGLVHSGVGAVARKGVLLLEALLDLAGLEIVPGDRDLADGVFELFLRHRNLSS